MTEQLVARSGVGRSRRRRHSRRLFTARVVAGSLFTPGIAALAALAAWPIYGSSSYILLVVVSIAVAAAIAVVSWVRRWSGWATAGAVAGAVIVLGVPLAVPSRWGAPLDVARGLGEVASGVVLAWKDLVTVDLPVGSYRNLLVPALIVFLAGTCATLLLSWRDSRIAYAAVPVGLGMLSFGLFFGRTSVSEPLVLGPVRLQAPVETALGVAGLIACLVWLAWRTGDERIRALRRAAASSGVRIPRKPSAADRRRIALGAGMVAVAVVCVTAVVPAVAADARREVLRSAVGPDLDLAAAVSPLASYRAMFGPDRADQVLFTVDSDGPLPERVRLATLDAYDGAVYRTGARDEALDAGRFVRVPSALDAGEGQPVEVVITIDGLDDIWMPTVGQVERVTFTGERAAALEDGFYYNATAAAGVQTAGGGLRTGDRYVLNAVEPEPVDLSSITAPGGSTIRIEPPETLRDWVENHREGSGGAALAGLAGLLRERGFLSHALAVDEQNPPTWMLELGDYRFQASASGHSIARVDSLFRRLLEREADERAVAPEDFVAAVGDDEQFAVAIALIAQELGFPARVVVGAYLSASDPDLPTCDAGVCRARDLSAWVEVQSSEGQWVPIAATPQHENSPSLEFTRQRDPELPTDVRPDSVEEVVPPEPFQEDDAALPGDPADAGIELSWLWPALRIAGLTLAGLALIAGPFVVVAAAKASRRRGRRTRGDAAARFAAGWDEYADAAVDAGRAVPASATRAELAAHFATPRGAELAAAADRAVFSRSTLSDDDVVEFWSIVDRERRAFTEGESVWRRLAATVSLKSFVRQASPVHGRRPHTVERGTRRPSAVRTTP